MSLPRPTKSYDGWVEKKVLGNGGFGTVMLFTHEVYEFVGWRENYITSGFNLSKMMDMLYVSLHVRLHENNYLRCCYSDFSIETSL